MDAKKFLIIIMFLFNVVNSFGQVKKDSSYYAGELEAMRFYMKSTKNLESNRDYITIFNDLISRSEYFKYSGYLDLISPWYNNVGHYNKGIELEDIAFPEVKQKQLFSNNDYKIEGAIDLISEKSKSHQVIMINEEHRMSRHRILTTQLLEPLYLNGYRYLALEALSKENLLKQGYPVLSNGSYIKDPLFGEMIRTAIKLGYKIISYEIETNSIGYTKERDPLKRQLFREKTQAKNIITKILDKDSNAKILVHGGRDHIAEVLEFQKIGLDSIEFGMMAGFFKKLANIDPFTVDQLQHKEHSDSIYESTIAKWVRKTDVKLNTSNILIDKKTNDLLSREVYDAAIIAKPTIFINNRPNWLIDMPDRSKLCIKVKRYLPKDSSFYMVQAIYKNEDLNKAIPADQYAYQKGQKKVLLFLKKGDYVIRILNNKGETLKQWEEKIN
ncbi:hypothetical protein [uncultured Psychroserpens sp.]|uniref:hypothetical protein n=1 Tax=uncultured Psychroserpens sp. TaxID=255436 RepID=UPI002621F1EB|nr:hypothetical protein [uncultured Psychroserpens sp.]